MWMSDLEVKDMPVPSSYNDISTEGAIHKPSGQNFEHFSPPPLLWTI